MSFIVNPPNTIYGPLTIASGTLTASEPALSITQTWTTGAIFTAALINVTDISSDTNSFLQNWQIGGSSVARLRKDGTLFINGGFSAIGAVFAASLAIGGSADLFLYRDAAATLAQRNGANAQTFKVYGTTDAGLTNYERLAISAQQGVGFTIGAETLGTGADNLNITIAPAGTGSVFLGSFFSADTSGNITANGIYLSGNVGLWVNNTFKLKKEAVLGWSSTFSVADVYDTAFYKAVAGRIDVIDGISDTAFRDLKARNLITNPGTFAALVAAATAGKGARAFINDGAGAVFGVAAAGGGALNVPVYSDGTNWIVG